MPRLKFVLHPYYGRLPVNAVRPCPSCGAHGSPCYFMCAHSPAWMSADQERAEALATEQEIATVGFQAWDSAQHRAHGLPCPYDGYGFHDDGFDPVHDAIPCEPITVASPAPRYVPDPPAWPDDDDLPF